MKILISTDLEGVAGVIDFEYSYATGKYYELAKALLTEEVNACCAGCVEKGVKEILVLDGHGSGGILPEKIHKDAKLFHGRPGPQLWFFDQKWDGIILLAHHSMSGTENGNLNHTYSSKQIVNMWLNREKIGEIGIEIYLAGCFGTPVILITGDEAATREAESYVPNIEKAIVKWGITRTSGISLSPEKAREVIREKTIKAIDRIKEIKPVTIEGECEIITEFLSTSDAFNFSRRPFFELVKPTTVRVRGENFLEVFKRYFSC
ncbi:MAG: M55 family metallopeptidase [Candidatus Omnitrophica bacterium]|nr:M55 family metallopeptidase [Candidatus Omnitrophota bacterium]